MGRTKFPLLVGREAESQVLRDCEARARRRAGVIVLLSGEAGIGKTRLYREVFMSEQGTSSVRLTGHGDRDASAMPLGPVVDSLRSARYANGRVWRSLMVRATWLSAILPELAPRSSLRDQPADRHLLFESVLGAVREGAGKSAAIWALDDMQWADPTSWAFVRHASRRVSELPIVLVVAYRPNELAAENRAIVLSDLVRHPNVLELRLERLDADATEQLVRQVAPAELGGSALATAVERSRGNPAVAFGLAGASVADAVPAVVHAYVKSRTADLSPSGRELLEVIAALGGRSQSNLLSSIAGPDVHREAISELVRGGLVSLDQGTWLRCEYPLFAEAVYEQIAWQRRRSIHLAIADAMGRGLYGWRTDVRERARHRELAGEPLAAFHDLVDAAAAVRADGRTGSAARLVLAADELAKRHEDLAEARESLRGGLLDDLAGAGHWVEVLRIARDLWADQARLRPQQRGPVAAALAVAAVMTGRFTESWNPLRPELAQLAAAGHTASRSSADGTWTRGLLDRSREAGRRLRDLAYAGDAHGVQRFVECLDQIRAFYHHRDRDLSALSHLLQAQLAQEEGLAAIKGFALWNRARMTTQVEHAYEAEAIGDRTGSWVGDLSRLLIGALHLLEGRTYEAAEAFEQSGPRLFRDAPLLEPAVHGLQAQALIQEGKLDAARQVLRRWEGSDFPGTPVWAVLAGAAGWLAWVEGDYEAAAGHLARCASESAVLGYGPCESGPLLIPLHADALLRLERRDEAQKVVQDAADLHRFPDRFFAAAVALANFRLHPSDATAAAARLHTTAAPWPFMARLTARWREEILDRTRRPHHGRTPGSVSQRELEIAELIAQGLTNKAIANRLCLSPYTVGTHVKNVLTKLEFNKRAQIAAWLRDPSPSVGGHARRTLS